MAPREEDWAGVLDRLLEGDRLALAQLSRLVNSFLARWNAYDFRDEWDDLIQEVVIATAIAWREGRVRERKALVGFVGSTARFKFADRLRAHLRLREDDTLPWEAVIAGPLEPATPAAAPELRRDLHEALARLPERERRAVTAVHVEARSYEEAATATGIPLGSLKRHLRDGLARLRVELAPLLERGLG
jgi:RNA polymerase sigma-70 factor (ECF subfamily)